jgi:hypothetical protein
MMHDSVAFLLLGLYLYRSKQDLSGIKIKPDNIKPPNALPCSATPIKDIAKLP